MNTRDIRHWKYVPIEVKTVKPIRFSLELTNEETDLLRRQLALLGTTDRNAVSLQLKIANAIIDAM